MSRTPLRQDSQSASQSRHIISPATISRVLLIAANPLDEDSPTPSQPDRVLNAPVLLRLWHLGSLDAPTVAVTWSLAFAWAARVQLPAWVPILLALGTWAVYIGDRLLDARTALACGEHHRLRERHHFHWRNRNLFIASATLAACAAAAIIFVLMPVGARERNAVLALAALAYFAAVHSRRRSPAWLRFFLSKEFLVGTIFTAGCALPTFSRLPASHLNILLRGSFFTYILFFAFLAWLNCYAIEHWESAKSSRVFAVAIFLSCIGFLLSAALYRIDIRSAALLGTGSIAALLLAFLDTLRGRMTVLSLRASADLVLLTPLLLIPLAMRIP